MKIGFIAHYNPNDRRAWSGTYSAIIEQLKKNYEVELLYKKLNFFEKEYFIEQMNWYRWIRKKRLVIDFLKDYSKLTSRKLDRMLKGKQLDLLIAPASNQRFAYSKTNLPIIIVADSTFVGLNEYYPSYSNVQTGNYKEAVELDKKAYHKAKHIILASKWAADSAIKDYNVDPDKITIIPFGANLQHLPDENELKWEKRDTCRLLFLGVHWQRKGGDIALKAVERLEQLGMKVHLTIIGCVPPNPVDPEKITVIPFLNKNVPEEEKELFEHLKQSDFFILPTRAECAGIVFCEASAFGLPIVATDTGGVSSYVVENQNGFLLPVTDNGEGYAKKIFEVYNNVERYKELRKSCLLFYKENLTWNAWGEALKRVIEKVTI
jgi:glycosyltransferase involved in cell wall biosynthesis